MDSISTTTRSQVGIPADTEVKRIQRALIECGVKGTTDAWILSEVRDEIFRLDIQDFRTKLSEHITAKQNIQKERYDKTEARKYAVGDLILIQITSEPATGGSKKLLPKHNGSFRVRAVLNNHYQVEDLPEGLRQSRTVVASD